MGVKKCELWELWELCLTYFGNQTQYIPPKTGERFFGLAFGTRELIIIAHMALITPISLCYMPFFKHQVSNIKYLVPQLANKPPIPCGIGDSE